MTNINIDPIDLNIQCKYTLLSPVSHHDPHLGGEGNVQIYNRQLVRTPNRPHSFTLTSDYIHSIAEKFPIPKECIPIFCDEPFSRFVGIGLIKVFIDRYGRSDDSGNWGTGIFEGMEAYRRLSERIELAAPRSQNLKEFWNQLLTDMRCGPIANSDNLFTLLAVSSQLHNSVLFHLQKYSTMIVEMARHWQQHEKLAHEAYAKKSKLPQTTGQVQVVEFSETKEDEITEMSIPVPTHSGNDIRHDIRYCAMMHLFAALEMDLTMELPTGVKALFENGGNIAKGKSAPSTSYSLAQTIRNKYPSLALLGGCTDTFMLGDSNLHSVTPFWFGREFNTPLEAIFDVRAEHSVVDMLDNWTLHRHSGRTHDQSPMPYSFETIQAGAQLYVDFQLSPWCSKLEVGAFIKALLTYMNIDSGIGGQTAKGFGKVKVEFHKELPDKFMHYAEAYQSYLEENQFELQEGLKSGELCCGQVVCT